MGENSPAKADATVPVKSGLSECGWPAIIFVTMVVLAVGAVVSVAKYFLYSKEAMRFHRWNGPLMKDLRIAIGNYRLDYSHLPIPGATTPVADLSLRSRGQLLPVLLGEDVEGLNPRKVKYIDLSMAKDHKRGIWQEGDEWVLYDSYGEPFYIVLDTTGDGKIANPEFGADLSNAEYAEYYRKISPPAELPTDMLVYSSGKDRDPRTWLDNICSWRQH